ncbi:hypothetical protein DICVIV_13258 [Dictyocaulus viviparus]|uniref:Uncharacterized protein n=1 Tax=Dictyocaulus viviparus TaxID=29172 RepID=A0A0D8XEE3_DICVI|nr:hypothetical protein DICVIV_13258 [Dictyocaulus viviparus]
MPDLHGLQEHFLLPESRFCRKLDEKQSPEGTGLCKKKPKTEILEKFCGAWILAGLYTAIMVESATVGILFHLTLVEVIDYSQITVEQRNSVAVVILTFVVVSLIGYVLTVPCLCYAVQKHSASALIPYLVWRMLFSLIILFVVIWQATLPTKKSVLFRSAFYDRQFPVAVWEILIGTMFFFIALRAHREFTTKQLRRERSTENDSST